MANKKRDTSKRIVARNVTKPTVKKASASLSVFGTIAIITILVGGAFIALNGGVTV